MNDDAVDAVEAALRMQRYLDQAEAALVEAVGALQSAECEASSYLHGKASAGRTDRHLLLEPANDAARLGKALRGLAEGHGGLDSLKHAVNAVVAADRTVMWMH